MRLYDGIPAVGPRRRGLRGGRRVRARLDHEPWGVVVNEAAACGLPLVLSDRVGAAPDLLRDGENGLLVQAGDTRGFAAALGELARDATLRREAGVRSRALVADWGYEASIDAFVDAVRRAAGLDLV